MRTLAIECATEACSVALFEGEELVAGAHDVLGRGHAERLIPMIAELPDKGRAERILVSLGPGSFTGVRIGIAAAQSLGLVWQAKVFGYPTLALVAAMARESCGEAPVTVCMTGGHGEWFVQDFEGAGMPEGEGASLAPDAARARGSHACIAGSKASELAAAQGDGMVRALAVLPDACAALRLPNALLAPEIRPIYGRAPDARPAIPRTGAAS